MTRVGHTSPSQLYSSFRCEDASNIAQTVCEWRDNFNTTHSSCEIKLCDDSAYLEITGEIIDGPHVDAVVNSGWDNELTAICNEGKTTVVTIDLDPEIHRVLLRLEEGGSDDA